MLVGLLYLSAACGSADSGSQPDASIEPECVNQGDCDPDALCSSGRCVPASCGDDQISGNESDFDCGGDCVPCTEGQMCNGASDCTSRFCDEGICRDCTTTPDCSEAPGTFCSGGTCVDQQENGASCELNEECSSTVCESEGVCCNTSCDGDCSTGTCVAPACEDDLLLASTPQITFDASVSPPISSISTTITTDFSVPAIGRDISLEDGAKTTNVITAANDTAFDGVVNQLTLTGTTDVEVGIRFPSGGGLNNGSTLSASLAGTTVASVRQVIDKVTLVQSGDNTEYEVIVTWEFRGCQ